ncbi:uncharacterized protein VP01_347g3 [Puccinia sorghi]|uniref:Uncharacterized protein n=1 Tax=Puccinia sorghi TaxID=27349 RepID=A0A0L6UVY6_9BASI|nr:uncharacterized protein VP01_347g3 [Puccinia sorghi]
MEGAVASYPRISSVQSFHKHCADQDLRQFKINSGQRNEEKIENIKDRLLKIHPSQHAIQLSEISCHLEGSGTFIDQKIPKEEIKGHGRPKGSPKKQPEP